MLTFNLKKEWYEKIRSGKKTTEFREVKPYWTKRINTALEKIGICIYEDGEPPIGAEVYTEGVVPCQFVLGYTKQKILAEIYQISVINGRCTDLRIDKPVYAIWFGYAREIEEA